MMEKLEEAPRELQVLETVEFTWAGQPQVLHAGNYMATPVPDKRAEAVPPTPKADLKVFEGEREVAVIPADLVETLTRDGKMLVTV
jgi:hypothetical protein